ncbi:hypothetical protein [Bordetella genomosp. 11]|uniref:Thymidylate kinase-like domain-containing protein n=1 Tax=Bordetella genomosp. 11 TaxID=1416808 RepID=A0A261UMI6_9BORD|nr:hypothetical protein [Bordetella genomosp. 11]OZI63096.1 hypothetical protein CAL28_28795 [Bordetella genomosp. 11]
MDSPPVFDSSACARALREFIELGQAGRIPCVMLRPRDTAGDGIFQGDFDFLIDEARFDEILRAVFSLCQAAGVSFVLRQSAPFKRQVELLDDSGRRVTIEMWPHAELRTRGERGRLSRAGVAYTAYERLDARGREELLAALFLLHLHHKGKDLRDALVRDRLAYFADRVGAVPGLRDAMNGLLAGTMEMDAAHQAATAFLRARGIPITSPTAIALKRLAWRARRVLHWPAGDTTAVIGPDGSGKTALMDGIESSPLGKRFRFRRFKRLFRKPLFYWGSEPRNVRDEKRLWLILPVAWAAFSLMQLFTGWRRPLILDRYFYDYFVRNVRLNSQGDFRRIAAYDLCTALAPRPRRLIVASCTPAIIHQRKQEMSQEAIAALYEMYLDQVRRSRVPSTLFCYTGARPELSGRQVLHFLGNP